MQADDICFDIKYVTNPWEMMLTPEDAGLYQRNSEQKSAAYL